MIKTLIPLIMITAAAFGNPAPGVSIVMVDDSKAYPSNSIATPSDLQLIRNELTPLALQAAQALQTSTGAYSIAASAYNSIKFIGTSNIVTSTAYITSIGAQASAGTSQVIRVHSMQIQGSPVTNIHLVATFDKLQTISPTVDWRSTLSAGGSSTDWAIVTGVTCSWPSIVSAPGADTPFAYSFDVPAPSPTTAMFRILSLDDGGGGSGLFFLFYNRLDVDGRTGWTGTIVDNHGHSIEIKGGIAANPFGE